MTQKEAMQPEENVDVVRQKFLKYRTLMEQNPVLIEYIIITIAALIMLSEKSSSQTVLMTIDGTNAAMASISSLLAKKP